MRKLTRNLHGRALTALPQPEADPRHRGAKRLVGQVEEAEDSLRYYYLCGQCLPRVEVVNGPPVAKTQIYFVA